MNMELKTIILDHTARYPLMCSEDYVKLAFQHFCGPGHMLKDYDSALRGIETERSADCACVDLEDIGNGLVRCHLNGAELEASNERIARAFYATAQRFAIDRAGLIGGIALLEEMAGEGRLCVSCAEMSAFIGRYRQAGYPMLSHSEAFRAAYRPAYRVVFKKEMTA